MIGSAEQVEVVAEALGEFQLPLVVDPVMVATSGARLIDERALAAMQELLLPLARLLTPNAPELAILSGMEVKSEDQLREGGLLLAERTGAAVLAKGGHLAGESVVDLLVEGQQVSRFASSRIETLHTHGTGCTLASALATELGRGLSLAAATERARAFVQEAIRMAPGFGAGNGPLGHGAVAVAQLPD